MIKKKIINDPLYGFVSVPNRLIFEVVEHPYFQRLRHISQLGLAQFVYPGARHTRFQHALGAYHLMTRALESLREKGVSISPEEAEAAQLAVILHDIGHGPYSHSLEETLLPGIKHESLTYLFLQKLNEEFAGRLDLAMSIFRNGYKRKFFHQLVSGQLDIDRLDYLKRDSFFTGVQEGTIGVDRIIDMLNVHQDSLVVEEKGIYSIENFLTARRLMYWQVYLHKTSVSAERMLVNIIRRAKYLVTSGEKVLCSDALQIFLLHNYSLDDFNTNTELLEAYGHLDDGDVWGAVKIWSSHRDKILSELCSMLIERKLFRIQLASDLINKSKVEKVRHRIAGTYGVLKRDTNYLYSYGTVSNEAYVAGGTSIKVLLKTGKVIDLARASDFPQVKAMTKTVKKNFLCWPKNVDLSP
jgi:HD superfamily phosphohydrolase